MQEWLNWPLSKSGMGQPIEGSNPSLSATKRRLGLRSSLLFCSEQRRLELHPSRHHHFVLHHLSFQTEAPPYESTEQLLHVLFDGVSPPHTGTRSVAAFAFGARYNMTDVP